METRRKDGRETWARLLNWDKHSGAAERLFAQILRHEGFSSLNPSHPLGGPDGRKDIICVRDSINYIVGCYFPRGQQNFPAIKTKFLADAEGVAFDAKTGFIFVTNQELTLSERSQLADCVSARKCHIYHLERISSVLDSPACYGLRLDFLDIGMNREEQISLVARTDSVISELKSLVKDLVEKKASLGDPLPVAYVESSDNPYGMNAIFGGYIQKCTGCGILFQAIDNTFSTFSVADQGLFYTVTCPQCMTIQEFKKPGLL